MTDPVGNYARAVLKGKIVAGELVKLACRRHLDDLEHGPWRGLRFDRKDALDAIDFFPLLHHSQGEWAGGPFILQPWQSFIIGSLFGWKRADGTRSFRTAYNEVARKNGKSTLSAGVGLYLFDGDGEPGAQVFTAATKRDQARIVHSEAVRMVKASSALRSHIRVFKDNLNIEATASKYEPLGADSDTMDGLNVHGAIIDELHAHKKPGLWIFSKRPGALVGNHLSLRLQPQVTTGTQYVGSIGITQTRCSEEFFGTTPGLPTSQPSTRPIRGRMKKSGRKPTRITE